MSRRHPALLLAAVLVAAFFVAAPGDASAKRYVFKARANSHGVYSFKLRKVRSQKVTAALVSADGARSRLNVKLVRRAVRRGRLKLRPVRIFGARVSASRYRHRRSTARLVIRTARTKRGTGGGHSSSGSGTSGSGSAGDAGANTPPVPTGNCEPGQVWKVGNWPGACWRPYNDNSPFNRRVSLDAPSAPNSATIVSKLMSFGTPGNLTSDVTGQDDWLHPTYWSQPTDPVFTVHCYADWGTCPIEGARIRIPDAARPANGGDAHMTVVDQSSGWEYDFFRVTDKPAGGGTIVTKWGGKTRIDGDGLGSGGVAGGYGNLAGSIRAPELVSGEINHALFMVVKCASGKTVYPASGIGSVCSSGAADAPAMGQRFQLAMTDSQIDALAVPAWKKAILRAMAHYGMYVGDTGGGSWGVQFESTATYLSFGYDDPFYAFGAQVGAPLYNGDYVFNLRDGVDWSRYLRVVDPCTANGTCPS